MADLTPIFQLSLLASFIAGMIALFAPCCVTFLLPAYFANIFKEKKQVLLMTFIYSLGIFTVMLPVVLGARVLTQIFLDLHDQTYIIGGLFLIFVGFLGLLGVKLPMPHISSTRQAGDPLSTLYSRNYWRHHQRLLRPGPYWSPSSHDSQPESTSGPFDWLLLCSWHGRPSLPGQSFYRKRKFPK